MSNPARLSNEFFNTGEPAYAVSRDGVIRAWNAAAEAAIGYSQSEALNQRCWELLAGRDLFGNRYCCEGCPLREMAFDHQSVNSNEMRLVTADKKLKRFRITRLLIACGSEHELLVHLCREQREAGDGTDIAVANQAPKSANRRDVLTNREKQILALLSRGMGTIELASELRLSRATVRNHIQSIFYKLHVHNRLAAVRRGQDLGLI